MAKLDTFDYEYDYDSYPQPQFIGENDRRFPLFAMIFLAPFIISAISVARLTGLNYAVKGLGALCATTYLIASIRGGFIFPKEVLLFSAFLVWSALGIFVVTEATAFSQKLLQLLQFLVMIIIIAHYSDNVKTVGILLFSVLIGAAIVAVSAYVTGEYQRSGFIEERARIAGFALNANTFALILIYATAILLYFFRTWRPLIMKGAVVVLILVIARLIVASGSRAGFVSFVLLITTWFFMSYRKEILHRPGAFILTLIVMFGILGFLHVSMKGSFLEWRMGKIYDIFKGGRGGESIQERTMMVKVGLEFVASSPLLGVGIGHFAIRSGLGTYSHNNYIEIFSCTGIPGGVLYYFILVVLWLRLRRLSKLPLGIKARELVNIAKAFLVFRFVTDIATMSYYDKLNWIFLAVFIGWTYHEEQRFHETAFADADEYNLELQEPDRQYESYG